MSQLRRFSRPPTNPIQPLVKPSRFAGLRQRWPYYAAAVLIGVLALAWIDGGEEPIRPIVQQVDYSGQG